MNRPPQHAARPSRALVRPVSDTLAACALSFVPRRPIDLSRARAQHAAYVSALSDLGLIPVALAPLDDLPDATFVEDTAVVLEEVAIIARLGRPTHAAEVDAVAATLGGPYRIQRIMPPDTLEGGDVLRVGRTLYVGRSRRTTAGGIRQLTAIAEPFGYRVVPVNVSAALHLKTAASVLPDGAVLVRSGCVDPAPLASENVVAAPDSEPWATNVLAIGDTVLMADGSPKTRVLLERRGFSARAVDISEFVKAEAGITCLSVVW